MEVAAGLVIAEEVITHALEGAVVAGVAVAKPTLPLRATLRQFARSPEGSDPASLSRAYHTVNIVAGDLYIFGGATARQQLASNDIHVIRLSKTVEGGSQYSCIPALGRDGEKQGVPQPRASHSSCAIGERILIFGGTNDLTSKQPVEDGSSRVWVFDSKLLSWSAIDAEIGPVARSGHQAVAYDNSLMIIHGGVGADSKQLFDTWAFNIQSGVWSQLPDLPEDASVSAEGTSCLAEANGSLYVVRHSSDFTATTHNLNLNADTVAAWQSAEVPITFPSPGPRPRKGAGLVSLYTGQGRVYLLYIFGTSLDGDTSTSQEELEKMWSGIWALQLPAVGAAHAKDVVKESVGLESKESQWAEVEIVASEQAGPTEGKSHPGPRAFFGCDSVCTQTVLLWGGRRPDDTYAGDGWAIDFKSPTIREMLQKVPVVGQYIQKRE